MWSVASGKPPSDALVDAIGAYGRSGSVAGSRAALDDEIGSAQALHSPRVVYRGTVFPYRVVKLVCPVFLRLDSDTLSSLRLESRGGAASTIEVNFAGRAHHRTRQFEGPRAAMEVATLAA